MVRIEGANPVGKRLSRHLLTHKRSGVGGPLVPTGFKVLLLPRG